MERLTIEKAGSILVKDLGGGCTSPCLGCESMNNCASRKIQPCAIYRALKKLKEYEDMEEQKRLLKFPCAPGDIVFRIDKDAKRPIIALVVTEVRKKMLRSGECIIKILVSDDTATRVNGCKVYYQEEVGKKIFPTEEAAERALKKLNETEG